MGRVFPSASGGMLPRHGEPPRLLPTADGACWRSAGWSRRSWRSCVIVVAALGSGGGARAGGAGGAQPARAAHAGQAAGGTAGGTDTTTTSVVAGPARDMGEPGAPRPVPILMYHVVSDPFPDSPYPDLYVPKAEFQEQMDALKDADFTAVTLQEAWDSWHADGPLPRRPVVVSRSTTATTRTSPTRFPCCARSAGPACSTWSCRTSAPTTASPGRR